MEGKLGRFIERVKGGNDRTKTTAEPDKPSLFQRLYFGERIQSEEGLSVAELERIAEAAKLNLIAQGTLPWDGTPQAEIYATHTANQAIASHQFSTEPREKIA